MWLLLFGMLTSACGGVHGPAGRADRHERPSRAAVTGVADAVVRLKFATDTGEGWGSGFYVGYAEPKAGGLQEEEEKRIFSILLTARHVVDLLLEDKVRSWNVMLHELPLPADSMTFVLFSDPTLDFAVLLTDRRMPHVLSTSLERLRPLEKVSSHGFPVEPHFTSRVGEFLRYETVSMIEGDKKESYEQMVYRVDRKPWGALSGLSGGPVLGPDGTVRALHWGSNPEVSYAVPSFEWWPRVLKVLDERGYKLRSGT